jgi:hypothetical protein
MSAYGTLCSESGHSSACGSSLCITCSATRLGQWCGSTTAVLLLVTYSLFAAEHMFSLLDSVLDSVAAEHMFSLLDSVLDSVVAVTTAVLLLVTYSLFAAEHMFSLLHACYCCG